MENSTISMLIEIFNILSTGAVGFFAIVGALTAIFTLYYKITNKQIPKSSFLSRKAFAAFCFCCTAAFLLELTIFNFQHYLKFFADQEFHTTQICPQNPAIILTSDDNVFAEVIVQKNQDDEIIMSGVRFQNLNRRITSIFVEPDLRTFPELQSMLVQWTDEESTRGFEKLLYRGLPHENHTIIQPCGKVSQLTIIFAGDGLDRISQITINKQVPYYFSGLRLLVVSFLIFALVLFFNKKLRTKTSYYLFEYKFDPTNKKQNFIYVCSVALLILFSWFCVYTTPDTTFFPKLMNLQYNKFLVDALIEGRTYLDYGNPERLFAAERPRDFNWLTDNTNGYKHGVDWILDWVWYDGKFYSYFGIVPAVILYLPYKLVTGNYLSHYAAISIFISITIFLLALLWRFCIKKYMPDARFIFYLLSFLALILAGRYSGILRHIFVHTAIQSAGIMFSVAGILLLLKSVENEKINRLKLFFACLCLALVVGCRPNMIFVSLMVPVVLWKYRSLKLLLFIMIPYIMIAIPLCIYNYVRFDSIFEFGHKYMITVIDNTVYKQQNPIGLIIRLFVSSISYLITPYQYSLYFPFVTYLPLMPDHLITLGSFLYREPASSGMINTPIVFCLLYLFICRNRPKTFHLLTTFLVIAAIIITLSSLFTGFMERYMVDFATFIILPSLFCAYYWCNEKNSALIPKTRVKIVYILLAVSIFVGLFHFVTGLGLPHSPHEPVLYRYLEYSLGIFRRV